MELETVYNRYTFGKEYFDICKEAVHALMETHEEKVFKNKNVGDDLKEQIAVLKIYKGPIDHKFKEYDEATKAYLDREKANIDKIGYEPKKITIDKETDIVEVQGLIEKYGIPFYTLANKPNVVDPVEAREAASAMTDDEFSQLNEDWIKTDDQISEKVSWVGDLFNSIVECSFEDMF